MKSLFSAIALCTLACAAPSMAQSLSNPDSDFVDTTSRKAWHATVEETDRGHRIGNPDAEAHLIAFFSYTCRECAEFALTGDAALDLALLAPGHLSYELRPVINGPIDLTASLLAGCGNPAKFKVNHAMFLLGQERWMADWKSSAAFARQSWSRNTPAARIGLAATLDFDDMMARQRSYSRADLTRCLTDSRAVADLRADDAANAAEYPFLNDAPDRPHFILDGKHLEGVHSWKALYPIIAAKFVPDRSSQGLPQD